jgi:hypothetical protein
MLVLDSRAMSRVPGFGRRCGKSSLVFAASPNAAARALAAFFARNFPNQ